MTDEAAPAEAQRPPETWIPLLIAVCVCGFVQILLYLFAWRFVLSLSFWGIGGVPGRFVTGMTLSAVIGIGAWAVVWFGFVAKTRLNLMDRYFLIIMGSSMVVGALLASLLVLPDLAGRNAARHAEQERRQIAAEDVAFEQALTRTMAGGVLKPGLQRVDLTADRARLARAQSLLKTYRDQQAARLAKEGGHITHLEGSLRLEAQAYWDQMAAELTENDSKLADLARARGSWRLTGQGIAFSAASDLQAYNAHQMRLQEIESDLYRLRRSLLSAPRPSSD